MRKWYPTYVLPPLEIEMGRLEIDEIEEMIGKLKRVVERGRNEDIIGVV